jgi:hypothetical protein
VFFGFVILCGVSSKAFAQDWTTTPEVFDWRFYLNKNTDLTEGKKKHTTEQDAKDHWKTAGIQEGRAASPVFDVQFYGTRIGLAFCTFFGDQMRTSCR